MGLAPPHVDGKEGTMLRSAAGFFVLAIVAAALGFGEVAGAASGVTKVLFAVFLVLAAVSLRLASARSECTTAVGEVGFGPHEHPQLLPPRRPGRSLASPQVATVQVVLRRARIK